MTYMLDTNICIYLIKKKPQHILDKFRIMSIGDLSISSVTLSELKYGVEKSQQPVKNRQALEAFIAPLEILSYDELAADCYGQLRAYLEKAGTLIGSLDLMIAAHAKSLQKILVTHNTREFLRVPQLMVEDWAAQTVA